MNLRDLRLPLTSSFRESPNGERYPLPGTSPSRIDGIGHHPGVRLPRLLGAGVAGTALNVFGGCIIPVIARDANLACTGMFLPLPT